MTDVVRTPDERFEGLPDFPWSPLYHEWDGIRLARVEAGEGPDVVFFHGEPTWSFLWRHVLPPVLAAGHRCIAPDLPGFGRSDKPVDFDWYTYDRQSAAGASFLEAADVRDATVVVHDWGGPVGLRAAVEHPDRISRIVILDTGLFTGHRPIRPHGRHGAARGPQPRLEPGDGVGPVPGQRADSPRVAAQHRPVDRVIVEHLGGLSQFSWLR